MSIRIVDLWLPDLAPTAALASWALATPWTDGRWKTFARRYRAGMNTPEPQRLLALLAALSKQTGFSVGCYCENEARCHRSILRELLSDNGADITPTDG